jgi:hypothetical protein
MKTDDKEQEPESIVTQVDEDCDGWCYECDGGCNTED